jgi:hypothetical protein
MKSLSVLKVLSGLFLSLAIAPVASAQFLDSSAGIGAGFPKLFGNITAFSATTDVRSLNTNRQEMLRMPMSFALLDGKVRMEVDMTQMHGSLMQPAVLTDLKNLGLERVVSIIRVDRQMNYVVFPGTKSYVPMEMKKEDADAAQKNVQVLRTPLGKETIDNHPCTKNKVVMKSAKGATLLEATTWNASDMKEFPVQIAVQAKEGTTVMRFTQVQMTKPAASQFEPPSSFTKFPNTDLLMFAASQKQAPVSKPQTKTPARTGGAATKPPVGKPAATKPATAAAKTNPVPTQTTKPSATRK